MADVVFELELQDLHDGQVNPNIDCDSDDDIIEIDDVSDFYLIYLSPFCKNII